MGILDKLRKKPEEELEKLPLKNLERSLPAEEEKEEEEEEERKAEKEKSEVYMVDHGLTIQHRKL